MKLLVAAVDADPAGWNWTVVGELVVADAYCDPALGENHDSGHDCLVSFVGLASGRSTTCARVAEVDTTKAQLLEVIRANWTEAGGDFDEADLRAEAEAMLADAEDWPPGTHLRRYRDGLVPA